MLTENESHFANRLVNMLCRKLRMTKKFSIAHAPWNDGHMESRNSAVLKLSRILTNELRLNQDDWPEHLSMITEILNSKKIISRKNKSPNELFLLVTEKK